MFARISEERTWRLVRRHDVHGRHDRGIGLHADGADVQRSIGCRDDRIYPELVPDEGGAPSAANTSLVPESFVANTCVLAMLPGTSSKTP